jgi:hypothetical protein
MKKATLANPPNDPRRADLWLNHAIGYALVRDIRDYAKEKIDPNLSSDAKAAANKAIDDALYGVMMVLDGVPERFQNDRFSVAIESQMVLYDGEQVAIRTDSFEGFCMGYHGWLEGDFGADPIVESGQQ